MSYWLATGLGLVSLFTAVVLVAAGHVALSLGFAAVGTIATFARLFVPWPGD